MDQAKVEEELNRLLLNIAQLQEDIRGDMDFLHQKGRLSTQLEGLVRGVIEDVDYWTDQCTRAVESPPVLLRRMQTHLERLQRIQKLMKDMKE